MLEQVKQALQFGRKQIEKSGWCQAVLCNEKGEIDAKNAVYNGIQSLKIEVIQKQFREIYHSAREYLLRDVDCSKFPKGYDDLVLYNDTHGRTKEEILSQFDKAIVSVEKDLKPTYTYFEWL